MKRMRSFFALVLLLGLAEALVFYPLLPDRMAVHFNAAGFADGWGPKGPFFITVGIVYLVVIAAFGGLPLLIHRIPAPWINLPNKDYWLAPERAKQTYERLESQMLFFGVMTLLLLDGVFFLTFRANLLEKPAMSATWIWSLLVGFVTVTIGWIVSLLRSFRRPSA